MCPSTQRWALHVGGAISCRGRWRVGVVVEHVQVDATRRWRAGQHGDVLAGVGEPLLVDEPSMEGEQNGDDGISVFQTSSPSSGMGFFYLELNPHRDSRFEFSQTHT